MTLEVYGMYVYLRSDRDDRKNLQNCPECKVVKEP